MPGNTCVLQRHHNVLLRVQNVSSIDRDIEFVCQISEKYDVTEQLHAGVSVLTFLQKLTAFNDEKRGAKSTLLYLWYTFNAYMVIRT